MSSLIPVQYSQELQPGIKNVVQELNQVALPVAAGTLALDTALKFGV